MGLKIVGYISSDKMEQGFISHQIQNLQIKKFTEDEMHNFLLSWTEYKKLAPMVLNSLLEENYYDGICFYSIDQLLNIDDVPTILKFCLKKNLWIGFAKEKMFFADTNGLSNILKLIYFKKINKAQKDVLNLWAI